MSVKRKKKEREDIEDAVESAKCVGGASNGASSVSEVCIQVDKRSIVVDTVG